MVTMSSAETSGGIRKALVVAVAVRPAAAMMDFNCIFGLDRIGGDSGYAVQRKETKWKSRIWIDK